MKIRSDVSMTQPAAPGSSLAADSTPDASDGGLTSTSPAPTDSHKERSFQAAPVPTLELVAPKSSSTTKDAIASAIRRLTRERQGWLRALIDGRMDAIPKNAAPLPEDASTRPARIHLLGDGRQVEVVRDMVRIGVSEGFRVVARGRPTVYHSGAWVPLAETLPPEERAILDVVDLPGPTTAWVEDSGFSSIARTITIPPSQVDHRFVDRAAHRARRRARSRISEAAGESYREPVTSQVQLVKENGHRAKIAYALAAGMPLRMTLGYIEGGNLITGRLPNKEPYAVLGRQSFAISKALIERDASELAGRKAHFDDQTIHEVLARDIGVAPDNLFVVEQPDTPHLDMAMCAWTPGVVLLNDAAAAALALNRDFVENRIIKCPPLPADATPKEQRAREAAISSLREHGARAELDTKLSFFNSYGADLEAWWRATVEELEENLEAAKNAAVAERTVERELEAKGLSVIRVPGWFRAGAAGRKNLFNLLNGIAGVNPAGERFFIALGASKHAESAFRDALEAAGVAPTRYHFLKTSVALSALDHGGAINCLTEVDAEHPAR